MRPKHEGAERIEFWGARYSCPGCEFTDIERTFKFCPGCGARLLWEDASPSKPRSHHKGKY